MTPEKKRIVITVLQTIKGLHRLLNEFEKMLQELIKGV